jgi:membrane protein implicated in regulation of membrane protease activity
MLGFDHDTLLDLTVNAIPLAIMLFFVAAFALVNPFGWDGLASALQFALLIVPFVLLAILTYYAGKAVQRDEKTTEIEPGESALVPESESEDVEEEATA